MIFGTGYDYYMSRKFRRNNVIYDLEKHGKLDQLANGNRKALNGKRTHHVHIRELFDHLFTRNHSEMAHADQTGFHF